MDQTAFCSQDVASFGEQRMAPAKNAPCFPVPLPQFVPWEEMGAHVLQSRGSEGRRNIAPPSRN